MGLWKNLGSNPIALDVVKKTDSTRGNVRNRELTIIQRRILRRLRNKKRSIKRKISPRENRNSYIISQTTRKLSLFHADLLTILISILISLILIWFGIPVIAFCADGDESGPSLTGSTEQPPSGASTSKGTWWKKWITCFTPQTEEGGHSLSPPEPIPNWVEEVDNPSEDPSDSINDLRLKCAIIIESFAKTQTRDPLTWQDIAQRLALEDKEAGVGATRGDFQRLLGELQNPASEVFLRVLKALEKHPR
ncbi:hypothetical protein K2173_012869 (mitochondrion) [Erythroxylum novogranatense]|uniref:Uncharacterized protein n=1 Tax=Erythroxylum novogranatense TaxID=1862640 RepID=A0AAV8S4H2_9ROSI|nr:hypothetical protein K2173_012869 [Erythroxylum novogranatense]